jgi:flagellar biosynthetic protein FlhB
MAENQEDRSSEDLSEEASPYRLEELRRKGQVAQSRELTALIAFIAASIAIYALAPRIGNEVAEFMREVFQNGFSSRTDLGDGKLVKLVMMKALKVSSLALLPVFAVAIAIGVGASFAQVGAVFSTDPLEFDLNKINPIQGFGRLFSRRMANGPMSPL